MKAIPRISEAEWEVMEALWQGGPQTAQDVSERLAHREWSAGTIKTMLGRLLRKGALRAEREGKRYRYAARVERDSCVRAESESFLNRVFGGQTSPMLAHFLESRELSEEEIRELEALLQSKREPQEPEGEEA